MEPGEMRFWSNGLLEVDAQTLSAGKETRYLTWSWATTDSSEIRLVFLDRRIRFETLLSIERTHTYISKYDEQARSITYKTLTPTRDAIFLGNFLDVLVDGYVHAVPRTHLPREVVQLLPQHCGRTMRQRLEPKGGRKQQSDGKQKPPVSINLQERHPPYVPVF